MGERVEVGDGLGAPKLGVEGRARGGEKGGDPAGKGMRRIGGPWVEDVRRDVRISECGRAVCRRGQGGTGVLGVR